MGGKTYKAARSCMIVDRYLLKLGRQVASSLVVASKATNQQTKGKY